MMVIVLAPGAERQAERERAVRSGRPGDRRRRSPSLRARSVVRAWVLPLMSTALPLTIALFFGEVIVIFGGTSSNT